MKKASIFFQNITISSKNNGIFGVQSRGDYHLDNIKIDSSYNQGIYFNDKATGNCKLQNIDIISKNSSIYFAVSVTGGSTFNNLCLYVKDKYKIKFNEQTENINILSFYFKETFKVESTLKIKC